MPYTPSVVAYLAHLAHLEHEMAYFHVIDPAINASAGTVQATSADHAKDIVVAKMGKMGWGSYADYIKAAANHNDGTRTLEAVELKARA